MDRVWSLRADASSPLPLEHTVLPDGRIDLVFQLGALPAHDQDGRAYVVGPMRVPSDIRYDGRPLVLGVRFLPGAARALVPPPADELVDRTLDLESIWRNVPSLLDALASAGDGATRLATLERALADRVRTDVSAEPMALVIERAAGRTDIAALARAAGLSERQLQRRFRERVGLTPRMARRIARFSHATRILRRAPDTSWPELMHVCGFYDQPHLIREFRAFAGTTPTRFIAARRVGSVQDSDAAATQIGHAPRNPDERRTA